MGVVGLRHRVKLLPHPVGVDQTMSLHARGEARYQRCTREHGIGHPHTVVADMLALRQTKYRGDDATGIRNRW